MVMFNLFCACQVKEDTGQRTVFTCQGMYLWYVYRVCIPPYLKNRHNYTSKHITLTIEKKFLQFSTYWCASAGIRMQNKTHSECLMVQNPKTNCLPWYFHSIVVFDDEECIMLLYLKVIIDTLWLLYLSFHLMAVVLWVFCLFSFHQPMIKSRSWHWIHTQMYTVAISCILAYTYTHIFTHKLMHTHTSPQTET